MELLQDILDSSPKRYNFLIHNNKWLDLFVNMIFCYHYNITHKIVYVFEIQMYLIYKNAALFFILNQYINKMLLLSDSNSINFIN